MSTLLIEGGHKLEGRVSVEGNKNAALPLLAACLLTDEECVLTNVPRIGDVEVMARLLLDLGAEIQGIGTTTLRVRTPSITTHAPDQTVMFRRAVRSPPIWRRCMPWERGRSTVMGIISKRPRA
jgi:UDP-N-acetylglucosamine 1-carboxyvinyltransferase